MCLVATMQAALCSSRSSAVTCERAICRLGQRSAGQSLTAQSRALYRCRRGTRTRCTHLRVQAIGGGKYGLCLLISCVNLALTPCCLHVDHTERDTYCVYAGPDDKKSLSREEEPQE